MVPGLSVATAHEEGVVATAAVVGVGVVVVDEAVVAELQVGPSAAVACAGQTIQSVAESFCMVHGGVRSG